MYDSLYFPHDLSCMWASKNITQFGGLLSFCSLNKTIDVKKKGLKTTNTLIQIHTYMHTHARVNTYIHSRIHRVLHLFLQKERIKDLTYIHIYIHMQMHACTHKRTYTHTYIHTHTHTQGSTKSGTWIDPKKNLKKKVEKYDGIGIFYNSKGGKIFPGNHPTEDPLRLFVDC
jgi:hypothetical protein